MRRNWEGLEARLAEEGVSPRLVRDPLLVHVFIECGENPHDLSTARVHHDVAAHGIQHVHRLDAMQLPRPGSEGIRLGSQCSDWTEI